MAVPDLTTLQKVEDRWHVVSGQEQTNALALIGMASRILRRLVPSVDDRVASGDLDPDLVADVVNNAVLRVLQNPEGIRRVSVDDYTEERDSAVSSGGLVFTDAELDLLAPADKPSGAFTIAPSGTAPFRGPW